MIKGRLFEHAPRKAAPENGTILTNAGGVVPPSPENFMMELIRPENGIDDIDGF